MKTFRNWKQSSMKIEIEEVRDIKVAIRNQPIRIDFQKLPEKALEQKKKDTMV